MLVPTPPIHAIIAEMVSAALSIPVTFQQYVAAEQTSQVKHQLFAGEVFDMSGGTPEHAALILAVGGLLHAQLRERQCRAFSSDLRVRAGDLTTYPDVSVVCGPLERDPEDPNTVLNPTVIVEVLSDSTEAFDRGKKSERYRGLASLREYVVVSQHEPHIEVLRRTDEGWMLTEAKRGQTIRLASIGCELVVDEVFAGLFEEGT